MDYVEMIKLTFYDKILKSDTFLCTENSKMECKSLSHEPNTIINRQDR